MLPLRSRSARIAINVAHSLYPGTPMALYESEITRFLRDLKAQRPQILEEQRKGRALWWDRPQDLDTNQRDRESRVRQQPYVYQIKG